MEKRVLYGLVVMLMCLVNGGFSQDEVILMSEEAKWEQFLSDANLPIVVTVTSSACDLPCALVKEQVAQLAKTYDNKLIFNEVDLEEKPFFVELYKVVNVPTVIVFKDGKEIKRLAQNFYWGSVYDLIFKENIFYSAPSPSDSAPPPFNSAPSGIPTFDGK